MRQGGAPPTGKWIGSPQGGVETPDAIILPDPEIRFAATAARLDRLAEGHPMHDWLRWLGELSRAQTRAVMLLGAPAEIDAAAIEQAVTARMPPLAADSHRRDPLWRTGLTCILDHMRAHTATPGGVEVVDRLQRADAKAIEALADAFLGTGIDADDAAAALYVAAAMQVYFTVAAAALPVSRLRLLAERGLCPCCGSPPVSGLITASGKTPGTRYLYCSLCSTAWNHVRAVCITCTGSGTLSLKGIEGDAGVIKAETCDDCHTYAKMLYQAKEMKVDPYADDLASLALDVLVGEAGFARHAPNPLLLAG